MKIVLIGSIACFSLFLSGCSSSGPNYPAAPGTMGKNNSVDRNVDSFYSEMGKMSDGSGD
ncbi:hypothetical protein [Puniceicoccus vermicola]|uniref:Lipoprotein n=1 Tax=Puniceicoccus vermicola TaxID=388746 RepID=A0A7X1B2K4_9BACT|nr:hypothetical protein [Puniceicoccus vermicola]MBC2604377.1 hypothetical protein [Puniceicoccus vermicola]